jgi:hypothetical protein
VGAKPLDKNGDAGMRAGVVRSEEQDPHGSLGLCAQAT